jgi:hypothetical protein
MDAFERADAARQLLETAAFKAVHAEIRNEIVSALETCAFDDIDKQHELVLTLQVHNRHKKKLERWVDDGKVEMKKLDHKNWLDKARERLVR